MKYCFYPLITEQTSNLLLSSRELWPGGCFEDIEPALKKVKDPVSLSEVKEHNFDVQLLRTSKSKA